MILFKIDNDDDGDNVIFIILIHWQKNMTIENFSLVLF